jgi:hypothetical protein
MNDFSHTIGTCRGCGAGGRYHASSGYSVVVIELALVQSFMVKATLAVALDSSHLSSNASDGGVAIVDDYCCGQVAGIAAEQHRSTTL